MPSPNNRNAPGRLGAFALLGAAAGSVPLPWVPSTLIRRVRGALVQDLAARYGISISPQARLVLADPTRDAPTNRATREAVRYLAFRMLGRFGPIQLLTPVRAALGTFVLGHLLARYFASRDPTQKRIDLEEAEDLRGVIDDAMIQALSASVPSESQALQPQAEDLRDDFTQVLDGVLIATATIPEWLVRRLETAFDQRLALELLHA
jgi:uncharacterized protein (DUF697 family)